MWPFNKKKVVKQAPKRGLYISDSFGSDAVAGAADTMLDAVMLASVLSDSTPSYQHSHAEAYDSGSSYGGGSSYDSGSSDCGGCDCGGGGD